MAVTLALGKCRQKDEKFKIIFSYIRSLRPAQTICKPLSQKKKREWGGEREREKEEQEEEGNDNGSIHLEGLPTVQ